MNIIFNAAFKAWQQGYNQKPFAEWLEQQKLSGLYWGA